MYDNQNYTLFFLEKYKMTVGELIKVINDFPLDAEIRVLQNDTDVNNSDKLTTLVYQSMYDNYNGNTEQTNDLTNHKHLIFIAD